MSKLDYLPLLWDAIKLREAASPARMGIVQTARFKAGVQALAELLTQTGIEPHLFKARCSPMNEYGRMSLVAEYVSADGDNAVHALLWLSPNGDTVRLETVRDVPEDEGNEPN